MAKRKKGPVPGPRMRPPPAGPYQLLPVSPALVGGSFYPRLASTAPGTPQVIAIPGIAADPDNGLAAVPERLLTFLGHAPTVTISIRQANQMISPSGTGLPFVGGLTRFSVAFDDVTVYSAPVAPGAILEALVAAGEAVRRLVSHPVRWQDPAAWQDRPCWYQATPAVIRAFNPMHGAVLLETPAGPVWVDILSDRVVWVRETTGDPDADSNGVTTANADPEPPPVVPDQPAEPEPDVRPTDALRGLGGRDGAPVGGGAGDTVADR